MFVFLVEGGVIGNFKFVYLLVWMDWFFDVCLWFFC